MTSRRQLIKDTIDFIEDNLETINVDEACAKAPYSKWEFQRIFRSFVGDSIGGYIRSRRLTEAAKSLIESQNKRVLDVAVEAGFNSQEAFARSFKKHFKVTPSEVREQPNFYTKFKKLRLHEPELIHIDEDVQREPDIVHLPQKRYVGISAEMNSHLSEDPDYLTLAEELWRKFNLRRQEIGSRVRGLSYGVAYGETQDMLEDRLKYLCCVEVTDEADPPTGMEAIVIDANTYACFRNVHRQGHARYTISYIYGIWLQNSEYERAEGVDYEIFDKNFIIGDTNSASLYCIPVRKKA